MRLKTSASRAAGFIAAALSLIVVPARASATYPDGLYAEVATAKGLIVIRLEFEKVPMTVANFVGLAEGTIANAAFPPGKPFFDGSAWHRVVSGHVIQGGVPKGGSDDGPGYMIPNEIVPGLNHGRAGMVNMANGGPHTNGSQWCIMLGDRSYLDGDYTVFGSVVEGLDVVLSIVQGDEMKNVKIVRVGPAAEKFRPTTASFHQMVEEANVRVAAADEKKRRDEDARIAANWPGAVDGGKGLKTIVLRQGRGDVPAPGAALRIAYSGKTLDGKNFVGTAEEGRPYWGDKAEPFVYRPGATRIHPGFDASVRLMKPGEKRLVIVPADQAYGRNGYYAGERKGEKRFFISPGSVLVYEIELLEVLGPGDSTGN